MDRTQVNLLWVLPSFGPGPISERFAALAGALGGDYDHAVCALDGDFGAEADLGPSVQWRRIDPPARKARFFSLGNMWSLRKMLNAERPDLVVSANWGGVEWLMVNRGPGAIPHVHLEESLDVGETPEALDPKRAWTRRRAFPGRNRAFVAPSRMIERLLCGSWGASEEAVHYIPNGVDVGRFAAPARESRGRMTRIAHIGPLTRDQRIDRLIRTVAELKRRGRNVGLVLLGEGPEKSALMNEAERQGVERSVDFIGEQRDVAPFLAQFDVYALSGDAQETPISLVQAMASGLPVVSTDVGDVAEMVAPSNKVFVRPADDESALVAATELLVSDRALRNAIGAENRERAATLFSFDAMVRRYDQLFREMTRKGMPLMLPAPSAR